MKGATYKYLVSMLGALILTVVSHAQVDFDDNVDDLVDMVPLDGGLSILLGAGIALGAKKAYQYSKERKNNMD
jgi:hypothetical protein